MICPDRLDWWSARVRRLGLLGSRVLDEVKKMVLLSAASIESWYFFGLSS